MKTKYILNKINNLLNNPYIVEVCICRIEEKIPSVSKATRCEFVVRPVKTDNACTFCFFPNRSAQLQTAYCT